MLNEQYGIGDIGDYTKKQLYELMISAIGNYNNLVNQFMDSDNEKDYYKSKLNEIKCHNLSLAIKEVSSGQRPFIYISSIPEKAFLDFSKLLN